MCSAATTPFSTADGQSPTAAREPASTAGSDWAAFLASQMAGCASATSSTASELQHLHSGSVLCDLAKDYGLIEAVGPDAAAFLHGQLSSDVAALGADRVQLSTYSSPKGRVLATLLLWRSAEGFLLQLPASVAAGIAKRLSMYVLRSKVRLAPSTRFIRLGLAGAGAAQTLAAAQVGLPDADFGVASAGSSGTPDWVLRLPGARYELVFSDAARAAALWQRLCSAGARIGNGAAWQWASIRSGIADIGPETQDQFVLQMLNYDLLGGVSFTKGCYPGQEIVARTQYRGETKRRTLLLHGEGEEAPAAGQSIHAVRSPDQPIGTVLAAAAAPEGGFDALACVHLDLAENCELRLGRIDGPSLQRLALPYALPNGLTAAR